MMGEYTHKTSKTDKEPSRHSNPAPVTLTLTRDRLEASMIRWAYTREGIIAGNLIASLIGHGAVLNALERVSESMQATSDAVDDDVAMIQSAWMNYQQFGSPGFPVSTASVLRDQIQISLAESDEE